MLIEELTKEAKCLQYVLANATKGSPQSVYEAIDKFCHAGGDESWMMNTGDEKGPQIDAIIEKRAPSVMVELGGYVGYSAVRFGGIVRKTEGHYYSIEINPIFANIAQQMIDHAGLTESVTIIVGAFASVTTTLKEHLSSSDGKVDMFFIDHWKAQYLPDIQVIEKEGFLANGSVIIADNTITPGTPDYLEYVRSKKYYANETIMSHLEYSNIVDAVEVSTYQE